MDDLTRALQDADPMTREPGLSPDEVDAMRRRIAAAARNRPPRVVAWPRPLVFAAAAIAAAACLVLVMRLPRTDTRQARVVSDTAGAAATDVARRQLQFATPGGTRIIWVFDPEFNP